MQAFQPRRSRTSIRPKWSSFEAATVDPFFGYSACPPYSQPVEEFDTFPLFQAPCFLFLTSANRPLDCIPTSSLEPTVSIISGRKRSSLGHWTRFRFEHRLSIVCLLACITDVALSSLGWFLQPLSRPTANAWQKIICPLHLTTAGDEGSTKQSKAKPSRTLGSCDPLSSHLMRGAGTVAVV